MSGQEYNGYPNRESWNVALWIDNEQGLSETVADAAKTALDSEETTYDLAQWLKDFIEEFNPLADDASLYSDMLSYALACVEWTHLAENYMQEAIDNHWRHITTDGALDVIQDICHECEHFDAVDEDDIPFMTQAYTDGDTVLCATCYGEMVKHALNK